MQIHSDNGFFKILLSVWDILLYAINRVCIIYLYNLFQSQYPRYRYTSIFSSSTLRPIFIFHPLVRSAKPSLAVSPPQQALTCNIAVTHTDIVKVSFTGAFNRRNCVCFRTSMIFKLLIRKWNVTNVRKVSDILWLQRCLVLDKPNDYNHGELFPYDEQMCSNSVSVDTCSDWRQIKVVGQYWMNMQSVVGFPCSLSLHLKRIK